MSAQEILSLIESVDPADTAKLDEIDARVFCYLFRLRFQFVLPEHRLGDGRVYVRYWRGDSDQLDFSPLYTRSRDALKAIRPEGWHYECNQICDGTYWAAMHQNVDGGIYGDDEGKSCEAWYLKTEELAELHAIIQAIEHERKAQ